MWAVHSYHSANHGYPQITGVGLAPREELTGTFRLLHCHNIKSYCRFSSNNASRSVTVDRHGRETMPCRHTHIQTMMRSNTNRWEVCVDESRRGKKRLEGSLILKPKRRNTQCGVAACPSPGAGAPEVLHRHKLWFISAQRLLHTPAFKWKPLFQHLTVLWLSLTYRSHHIKITKYVTFCTNLLFTCLRLLETQ